MSVPGYILSLSQIYWLLEVSGKIGFYRIPYSIQLLTYSLTPSTKGPNSGGKFRQGESDYILMFNRSQFQHCDLFLPSSQTDERGWTNPNQCVWGAPVEMTTKFCLDRLYTEYFEQFDSKTSQLAFFFLDTLEIPICTWENVADEIRALKFSDAVDFDRLSSLYGCFDGMNLSDSDLDILKYVPRKFEKTVDQIALTIWQVHIPDRGTNMQLCW